MEVNTNIAKRIKKARLALDYTSEYVAQQLNLSKAAYSNLENGKVEITFFKLYQLTLVLEKNILYFIKDLPLPQSETLFKHPKFENDKQAILTHLAQIHKNVKAIEALLSQYE